MDFSNVESPKMTYASALPFQLAPPLNSSIQTSVPKGAREVFTEERWKGMKPIIRQLYTIERKPYGRVIEILRTEHDFFPTRKQFYRKINEWGFGKNVKGDEMRQLMETMHRGVNTHEEPEIRGVAVPRRKIERWQKKRAKFEGAPVSSSTQTVASIREEPVENDIIICEPCALPVQQIPEPTMVATMLSPHSGTSDVKVLCDLLVSMVIDYNGKIPSDSSLSDGEYISNEGLNDLWNPRTAISSEDFQPPLANSKDLVVKYPSGNSSDSDCQDYEIIQAPNWKEIERDIDLGVIHTLSPFPNLPPSTGNRSSNLEFSEYELRYRLSRLTKLFGAENPGTLKAMGQLADMYFHRGNEKAAERFYKKIACAKQKALGFKHLETLSCYLDVIEVLIERGYITEAKRLCKLVHAQILSLVGLEDQLALRSMALWTHVLYYMGRNEDALRLLQQNLQIALSTYGLWHNETSRTMWLLSKTLADTDLKLESEQVSRTVFEIQNRKKDNPEFEKCFAIYILGNSLYFQGRYEESRSLFQDASTRWETLLGRKNIFTLCIQHYIAICLSKQGLFVESEDLFRKTLEIQIKTLGKDEWTVGNTMFNYAIHLSETNRHAEAVPHFEARLLWSIAAQSPEGYESLLSLDELGWCYEKLGRYKDALTLYYQHFDRLSPNTGNEHRILSEIRRRTQLLEEDGWGSQRMDVVVEEI